MAYRQNLPVITLRVAAPQTSTPVRAPAGTEITVTIPDPVAGGSGACTVDYTLSSDTAVQNGTATWVTGGFGTYSASGTTQKVYGDCWVRVVCTSGSASVLIDPMGATLPSNPSPNAAIAAAQVAAMTATIGDRIPADANAVFTKYGTPAHGGSWGNTCATNITIGTTTLTHSLSNERPRFETYTRKCVLSSAASEIRFASASFTADQTEKALAVDVYIENMPSEFLAASNPFITVQVSNTTALGSNYSRWVFDAGYIRQGWNTLKMRQADTVTSTSGGGNLPTGCNHPADIGTGFDWTGTGQFFSLTFTNMNGFTVHVDQLRRPAKAKAVLTIGFDASGYNATDEIFVTKVAPLFAQYGIKSYCTMTNIYELIFSGSQAWTRLANLYNNFGWDVINHTWSHGGTDVGRVVTLTSLTRATNVCTGTVSGGHGLTVNRVIKASIQGATGTPGTDMNTSAAAAMPDFTVTSTTQFTYASTGTDGTATGTPKLYTFLSEVFTANNAENLRLLGHELTDIARVLKANGFSRGLPYCALPNNSVPELSALQTVAKDAGISVIRAYRGGYTFVNELGIDNPLNMGSFVMDSGTAFTKLSDLQAKVAGAIARGDHIHIFGHFILDDEDPANAAYVPVDPDYPPSQGGNPNPPAGASLSGFGGWWYYSQLRKLVQNTIGPAIANGTLIVKSPSQYAAYMGAKDLL